MGYDEFMLIVNSASITILLVLALLLCFATRLRGESSYAAWIILFTTLPVYFYHVCHGLEWYDIALLIAPFGYSVNLTLMPLLWFLVQRGFDPGYRLKAVHLLHFLPAFVFYWLVESHVNSLRGEECLRFILIKSVNFDSLLTGINFSALLLQMVVYFTLIFRYLRRMKHYVFDHYSNAQLANKIWIPRLITLIGLLLIVAMCCYGCWPRANFWLFYVLNVITMSYLVYQELETALSFRDKQQGSAVTVVAGQAAIFDAEDYDPQPAAKEDTGALRQYACQAEAYLQSSEAYVNPDLSLKDVARATGISSNNLSRAINSVLGKNFFELVNGLRVEKSKSLLLEKKERGLTLETIAEQCGFNSQHTFCRAFKKGMGVSTSEWLKSEKNK